MSVPEHQNGALLRGPLPDIQENELLHVAPSEVKVIIRENPLQERPSTASKAAGTEEKEKKPRTPLEKFLISTCILLSSCVVVLLLLLMFQTYMTGDVDTNIRAINS
jgi:hypothetical protein